MMSLIFAWLNFAIFIAIGRYAYQKWFKTQLEISIKAKADQIRNLQNEVSGLQNQIKELTVDVVLQEKQSLELLDKLKLWRAVFMADQQIELQKSIEMQAMIAQNNQIKLQNIAIKLAQKQLLVDVVAQAGDLLHEQFKRLEDANLMMDSVLAKLEQR
jgi:hypothetical protein